MISEYDYREIARGTQVTLDRDYYTIIGEIGNYLGDGNYIVIDSDDDKEIEAHKSELVIVD